MKTTSSRGYELGADDYVTKPYSMAVLYAKTKALIAGAGDASGQTVSWRRRV